MADAIPVNSDTPTEAPKKKQGAAALNIPADVLETIKEQVKAELKAETGMSVVESEPAKKRPYTYKVQGHEATCTDN